MKKEASEKKFKELLLALGIDLEEIDFKIEDEYFTVKMFSLPLSKLARSWG